MTFLEWLKNNGHRSLLPLSDPKKDAAVIAFLGYSALEDRVMANLSQDKNKLALFLEDLDGHSLSATYYYKTHKSD